MIIIKLETGVEGLVHISEISHERVKSVSAALDEGQDIEVKILSVDPDAKSLSGRDWRLQVEKRGGRHWTGGLWVAEVSDLFEINDLGFSSNAERLDGGFRFGYREILPGSVFRNYNAHVMSYHNWSHEALDDTWSVGSAGTRGPRSIWPRWRMNCPRLWPRPTRDRCEIGGVIRACRRIS